MPILLLLKKLLARCLFPVPFVIMLLVLGMSLVFFSKRFKKVGKIILSAAVVLLVIISITGSWLLTTLTSRYPGFTLPEKPEPHYVVGVLASSFFETDTGNPNDHFGWHSQVRLLEGCRIAKMLQNAGIPFKLVISTGNVDVEIEIKKFAVEQFLQQMNLADCDYVINPSAYTTKDELLFLEQFPSPKIIVSEAFHMPRIMLLAQKLGYTALPAPAAIPSFFEDMNLMDFVPSANSFYYFETAVYEYLGMLEYTLFSR